MPVTEILQAASIIATTVNSISDVNKRRQIESTLALLSNEQQIELANNIARQQNRNAQIEILTDAVSAAQQASLNRQQQAQIAKWIIISSVGVLTLFGIIWYLKKK